MRLHALPQQGGWPATYVGLLTGGRSKLSKRSFASPLVASLAAATTAVSGLAQHQHQHQHHTYELQLQPCRGPGGTSRRAIDSRTGRPLVTNADDETSATRTGGAVARRWEVTATPRCAVEAEGMGVDVVDDAAGRGDGETRRSCCLHGGRPPRLDTGSSAERRRHERGADDVRHRLSCAGGRGAWHRWPPCRRGKGGRERREVRWAATGHSSGVLRQFARCWGRSWSHSYMASLK